MRIFKPFACPRCGYKFPFFAGYSRCRIRTGLLSAPWYKCPDCETTSRQTVAWLNALWAWPLTFMALVAIIAMFRNTPYFVELHHSHPGVYGGLGGLVMGLILGFGLRIGLRLVPLWGQVECESRARRNRWLVPVFILAVVGVIGFVTHRWLVCGIGLVIGIAVWTPYYLFAKAKTGQSVEPTNAP